ncbi:MAG: hypothetical protein IT381_28100 [Deltaproteobacteria bacterium]|nr:hypothetical protein [Deltaproteobacteria bacterium]
MPIMHGHSKADARNLGLHQVALKKLAQHPELRVRCIALVDRWLAMPERAPSASWLRDWRQMLETWSDAQLASVVLDEVGGQTLRQCSPLGPALTPRERSAALIEINRSFSEPAPP